jgi:predicted homoserine dehydrogenase-like protein
MKMSDTRVPPQSTSVYDQLQAREAAGRPIRVGAVGAVATGRAIAPQLGVPGMRLAAIANRTPAHAKRALREAAIEGWETPEAIREPDSAIARGRSDSGPLGISAQNM